MQEQKAGAQIGARAFYQSLAILLVLMLVAGILTQFVPAGSYIRIEQAGREIIAPDSYTTIPKPDYPFWRWFTAPFEVLFAKDGFTIAVIIVFLLLVGIAFAVMDYSGLVREGIARIVKLFGRRKYALLLVVSLFFMSIGAFFGIFEEVVPLVPVMIALSYYLGWDALIGLGMSILATNMGFSAAITNPFTIGVAQEIAGLPLFSGAWFRFFIFIAIYALLALFLVSYARRIEQQPDLSPVYSEDLLERRKYEHINLSELTGGNAQLRRALVWLLVFLVLIMLVLVSGPLVPAISGFSLPMVGVLFFVGGIGAGVLSGLPWRDVWKAARDGAFGIAPAIPLILMAASIKHIVAQGGILDTLLHSAANVFDGASPFLASVLIYALALVIEIFVASGSAKAFLLMPILLPLADLIGVTRQVTVTAYIFGDGFSNMAYPTNPVLLIVLGLTVVSYPRWIRWTLKLWVGVLIVTLLFLLVGVRINYGPF